MTFNLDLFRSRFDRLMAAIRGNLADLDTAEALLRRQVADFASR
jgi:hypothetical protein